MRCIWQVVVLPFVLASLALAPQSASAGLPGVKDVKKKAQEELKKKTESAETPPAPAPEPAEGEQQAAASPAPTAEPGEGVWVNYDFIPGDKVIFFDDFMQDVVGNFPRRLELLDGNMEIAEYRERRWVRSTTTSTFDVPLPEALPAKFTLEFDLLVPERWGSATVSGALPDDFDWATRPTEIDFSPWDLRAGLTFAGPKDGEARTQLSESVVTGLLHCRVMADGNYFKVYVNETRVANFPNCDFYRSNAVRFEIRADPQWAVFIGDIRVAASDKTMYDALVADGRVATHGILFDSGSDRIRPESTPTLKEIGTMLRDHPELRLRIEGHTDAVGDDAANQDLSERRAAAVRAYLLTEYGIGQERLEAQGFGESNPVASNDTPEGRQNNRRVELVKV